jgi:hypothetical protein
MMRPGPRAHDQDAVGQEQRLVDVVRDKNQVVRMRAQMSSSSSCIFSAGQRVQRAEGLVHQHHARVVDQHAGDFHALLHAARQLRG